MANLQPFKREKKERENKREWGQEDKHPLGVIIKTTFGGFKTSIELASLLGHEGKGETPGLHQCEA